MVDDQIVRLMSVLAALPEGCRINLARQLLPDSYALVRKHFDSEIKNAFEATAGRMHGGLQKRFSFDPVVIAHCWKAMVEEAARDASGT
jgi:hypothetical protein